MTITINGSGTITGVSAGGLPSGTVTQATLATPVAGTGPAFSAYQSSTQTISSATNTKILYQSKDFDTNTNYDTSLSRFTPSVAGYYQIIAVMTAPVASRSTEIAIYIYKNGSVWKSGFDQTATTTSGVQTSALVYCNGSTDYIEAYIYFATGGTTSAGYQNYIYFQGYMVRSA